jgi:lysozyme family protein
MPAPKFTSALAKEYSDLFNTCEANPDHASEIEGIISRIVTFKDRYQAVTNTSTVPWHVIAVIHNMECSLRFDELLHNGDPLTARTVDDPPGRPRSGQPPFAWEVSALDALQYDGLTTWTDWSVGGICYKLEGYNGWGYRKHGINTPYLWSYSNLYTSGKYIADGQWSDSAVSRQCGAAVILRRMVEHGVIDLASPASPKPPSVDDLPDVAYSLYQPTDPQDLEQAEDLQRLLNLFPGVSIKVDGAPGPRTSDAYKTVTGEYLAGDPRHG